MTPAIRYLRNLQLAHYNPYRDEILLPDDAKENMGYKEYLLARAEMLEKRITDEQSLAAAMLIEYLQEQITLTCKERNFNLKTFSIPIVGSIFSHHINARILKIPDSEEKLIVFDEGLFFFLDSVTTSLVHSFELDFSKQWKDLFLANEEQINRMSYESKKYVLETADFFSAYLLLGSPARVRHKMTVTLSKTQYFASFFTRIMEVFIMGHEWGHLLCGHLDHNITERKMMGSVDATVILKAYDAEYEADKAGVMFSAAYIARKGLPSALVVFCDVFFWYLEILERCMSILDRGVDEPYLSHTHPPAFKRKAVVENSVRASFESAWVEYYLLFRDNLERLCKPHFDYTIEQMWEHRRQGKMLHLQMH